MTFELRCPPPCSVGRPRAIAWLGMWLAAVLLSGGPARAEEPERAAPTSATQGEAKDTEAKDTAAQPTPDAAPRSPVPGPRSPDADRVPPSAPAVPRDPSDLEQARRRAFSTGVVMLGGILICGVGLIAIVLLWGGRTRRIARQTLPKVAPRDELWYLKHKVEADDQRPPDRPENDESSAAPKD